MTKDVVIIGCGITGAACAYELSKYKLDITILEKENDVSEGTTKANSAIIHAGFDPAEGSLMARLNVRGSELAAQICKDLDVPYVKNGAMVIALSEDERPNIEALYRRGIANGVKELRIIERDEIKSLEPEVSDSAVCALLAPTSAIVSPWEYCLAMVETAIRNGAEIKLNTKVTGIEKLGDSWLVKTDKGDIKTRFVINAAGCEADIVHDMALEHEFTIDKKKGEYFLLDKSEGTRISHTVFRCPGRNGKGVLVSPTVHGNLIVGPNSADSTGNDTSTTAKGLAYVKENSVKSVPGIDFSMNVRNFAGVRARTNHNDFIIREKDGFVDAAGICSPGLSSAPAIAEYIAGLIAGSGLKLEKRTDFINSRKRVRIKSLSPSEKKALIEKNPAYGEVVCRCETITKGEILDAFNTPIPPCSLDAVKRRVGTGMGRCQGGFCSPIIVEILAEKLGIDKADIIKDKSGSKIIIKREGL